MGAKYLKPLLFMCFSMLLFAPLQAQSDSDRIVSLAWNSNGTLLALAGTIDGQDGVEIQDVQGNRVDFFTVASRPVSLSWSPDDDFIATTYYGDATDILTHIIDVSTGDVIFVLTEKGAKNDTTAYWHPDISTNQIATLEAGTLNLWNVQTGQQVGEITFTEVIQGFTTLTWNSNGTEIFTISDDGFIKAWDSTALQLLREVQINNPSRLDLSFDGLQVAVASYNNTITILDSQTFQIQNVLSDSSTTNFSIIDVKYSPDGTEIAAYGALSIELWDVSSGTISSVIDLPDTLSAINPKAMDYSPDGTLVYASEGSNMLVFSGDQ